jgi:hypothetical protein
MKLGQIHLGLGHIDLGLGDRFHRFVFVSASFCSHRGQS